jgi:hypothetical protein
MLAGFAGRADLRRARKALTDSGIAARQTATAFLAHPRAGSPGWPDRTKSSAVKASFAGSRFALPLLLTWAEAAALKELAPPVFAVLDRLRACGKARSNETAESRSGERLRTRGKAIPPALKTHQDLRAARARERRCGVLARRH